MNTRFPTHMATGTMRAQSLWRSRGALRSWFIDSGGRAKRAQIVCGEVAVVNVIGADPLEVCLGSLRCTDGRELGDEVILARLIQ